MTSAPASTRLLAASASFTGIDQSPVNMTCNVAFGLASRAPSMNALTLRSSFGFIPSQFATATARSARLSTSGPATWMGPETSGIVASVAIASAMSAACDGQRYSSVKKVGDVSPRRSKTSQTA